MTQNDYHFRRAGQDDLAGIALLLRSCGLPIADIQVRPIEFTVVHHRDELVGVVGVEAFNEFGLLRSLAVAHAHRNVSIGVRLVDHACAYAGQTGVKDLFLLTTSAEPFFKRLGFQQTDRACVPDAVKRTTEFASLCPETAVCMRKHLASGFRFFSRAALPWRDDASGSAYWSVCLERSMLTYFEAPPDAKFERHSHEAEQITMVLEGELIFECDDRSPVRVKAHEVIAVPSGVPHAVKAGSKGAKAIDAWSPPYAKYATSRASNG